MWDRYVTVFSLQQNQDRHEYLVPGDRAQYIRNSQAARARTLHTHRWLWTSPSLVVPVLSAQRRPTQPLMPAPSRPGLPPTSGHTWPSFSPPLPTLKRKGSSGHCVYFASPGRLVFCFKTFAWFWESVQLFCFRWGQIASNTNFLNKCIWDSWLTLTPRLSTYWP